MLIVSGDFNHASTMPLTGFNLTDLCASLTRGNSTLRSVITSHFDFLFPKLRAPVRTIVCFCLAPRYTFGQPFIPSNRQIKSKFACNFSHNNLTVLQETVSYPSAWSSIELLLKDIVKFFTQTTNAISVIP